MRKAIEYTVGYGSYKYIKEKADKLTIIVALCSLLCCVHFGTWIRSWLPVNLVLLWIIIQVATGFIIWYYHKWKNKQNDTGAVH
ncbi:MAG: DUF6040 family protein [Lachnospiraceae bacterium]|nr:DUF6040 family protein [Lachnospiraceae bacterium]